MTFPKLEEPPSPADFKADELIIRALRPSDAEALTKVLTMPGVRNGTLRQPFQSIAQTLRYIEGLSLTDIVIAAEWRGIVLGNAGLHTNQGRRKHSATLGMGIHDDFTGKGIGKKLLESLIDSADNWHAITRIELTVFTDNTNAIALYEKFGFEKEGIMKQYAFRNGAYADCYFMARIR